MSQRRARHPHLLWLRSAELQGVPSVCVEGETENQVSLEHVAPHTAPSGAQAAGTSALPLRSRSAERRCVPNLIFIIGDVLMIHINSNFDAVYENGIGSLLRSAQMGLLVAPNACKSS